MAAEERLDAFEQRLRAIEARLVRLENDDTLPAMISREPDDSSPDAGALLALTGKSLIILGGAFLLRAATQSMSFPRAAGVCAGLLYAAAWIVAASRAARDGRRMAATVHAAVAAIIAYPIVWEATTRFAAMPAIVAAFVITLFTIAMFFVAHRDALPIAAAIGAAGATLDALLLAYATQNVTAFVFVLTACA